MYNVSEIFWFLFKNILHIFFQNNSLHNYIFPRLHLACLQRILFQCVPFIPRLRIHGFFFEFLLQRITESNSRIFENETSKIINENSKAFKLHSRIWKRERNQPPPRYSIKTENSYWQWVTADSLRSLNCNRESTSIPWSVVLLKEKIARQ